MAKPRKGATLLYQSKANLLRRDSDDIAIAELKVWEVPKSEHYPEGHKFSMFLVWKESGDVILGFDNHKPKGPHQHVGATECPVDYQGIDALIETFWDLVKKEGFLV